MLDAIKEIGDIITERGKNSLDILIQNPNLTGTYNHIITIELSEKDNAIYFCKVGLEEFELGKIEKYLYHKGTSGGADITPTSKITEPEKTFKNKLKGWFKVIERINIGEDELKFLKAIKDSIEENESSINEGIVEKFHLIKDKSKKENAILTLKIDDKYIGDIKIFRRLLEDIIFEKDKEVSTNQKHCSVCGIEQDLVFGNVNIFKFYTIDKPGFIAGGFDKSTAWKNFPVCVKCKLALEEGKKFLHDNRFSLCKGISYYLIPKFIIGKKFVHDAVIEILLDTHKRLSLKERVKKRITADENEILDILSQEKDYLSFNFLFLKGVLDGQRDAEKIELLIEDVLPSRIRKIFEAKGKVDEIIKKEKEGFNFGTIRYFFAKSDEGKRDFDLSKYFFEIIDKVFKGKEINFTFLTSFFMKKIRREFLVDGYFHPSVRFSLMNTLFFEALGLISFRKEVNMFMEESMFDSFFQRFGKTFDSPLKRGLFLLGVLTEMLLRKQSVNREAKPFMKQLKGLKMDERDIKGLLPKVQNKLEEYHSFDTGKRMIAKEASKYLLLAGDDWKMSIDEINFYFATGMNLADEVAEIVYPDKPEN